MNVILGTKFKMVMGYKDSASVDLAIERGEVQARGGMTLTGVKQERPQWVTEKKVVFLVQTGAEKEAEYPDVPLMHELARNDEERQILELISSPAALGRPFFLPPEVPADRVAALRKAFAATMKDPDYIAEGNRVRLDMNPLSAERVTATRQRDGQRAAERRGEGTRDARYGKVAITGGSEPAAFQSQNVAGARIDPHVDVAAGDVAAFDLPDAIVKPEPVDRNDAVLRSDRLRVAGRHEVSLSRCG